MIFSSFLNNLIFRTINHIAVTALAIAVLRLICATTLLLSIWKLSIKGRVTIWLGKTIWKASTCANIRIWSLWLLTCDWGRFLIANRWFLISQLTWALIVWLPILVWRTSASTIRVLMLIISWLLRLRLIVT